MNKMTWEELFTGYDELYAITFSSGIEFTAKLINKVSYAEIIYGCAGVVRPEIANIVAAQINVVNTISKSKTVTSITRKIEEGKLKLFVSMDTNSHEKIYILRTNDGAKTRVITGSANMSAVAFNGIQREEILCLDDNDAFEYFMDRFESFRTDCASPVPNELILKVSQDQFYLKKHIEETPIMKEAVRKMVVSFTKPDNEVDYVADVKNIEDEIKDLFPRKIPNQQTVNITADMVAKVRKNNRDKIDKEKRENIDPKLHLDMDNDRLDFCGKPINLNPPKDQVANDVECLLRFIGGFEAFNGDVQNATKDYYAYFNWFFATIFIPELRAIAYRKRYSDLFLPVFGILCGPSNAGKTKLVELLSTLMTGERIQPSGSDVFSNNKIDSMRTRCEGVPIMIEDLAKQQYENNYEKIIKNDLFGVREGLTRYPAISITANKIQSLSPDATKRVVYFRSDISTDKGAGARNAKMINDTINSASNALFGEYVRRMIPIVKDMEERMNNEEPDFAPDILLESSKVLMSIIKECTETEIPHFVRIMNYEDYFGDSVVGRSAIEKLRNYWKTQPENFSIDKKDGTLVFTIAETAQHELKYMENELPSSIKAKKLGNRLVVDLAAAREETGIDFKRRLFSIH